MKCWIQISTAGRSADRAEAAGALLAIRTATKRMKRRAGRQALLFTGSAIAGSLMWTSVAVAQSAPAASDTNTTLPEIVVTAEKRAERLQDVPASIVAETGAELVHRGATELQDIIDSTPGLNNPSGGPPNQTNLVIRGVTTGPNAGLQQSTVSLMYDDIPIDPGAGGAAGAGTTNLRVVDVERVEVLRGPQGTLFGSGSLSGAVRYITNKPDFTNFYGEAEVTGEGTQGGAASYNTTLMINAPLIEDKLAVRAVGYGYHDGGWIDDLKTGQSNINSTDTYGGRITFAAKPTDRLNLDLSLFYQDSKDNAQGDSYYTNPTGVSGQVSDGIYEPQTDSKNFIVNLTGKYDLGAVSIVSSTTYHDRKYVQTGPDYYFVPLTTGIATGFEDIVNGPDNGLYYINGDFFTQEVRLESNGSGPLKWTVGAFYLDSDNSSSQEDSSPLVTPYVGGPSIVDLVTHGAQQELAGFGEATYTAFGKLDLTAGVRVSHSTLNSTVVTGGYIPVGTVSPSAYVTGLFHETDTPVTPHFSIDYRFTPEFTVYAAAARGYRVGGINETSGVGGRASPTSYGPDSLWNYETGAKGTLFGDHLSYSADIYYIDWSNIQVSLANNLGNYTSNAGEARLYGVEGQVDARPVRWLKVGASFALSDNRVTKEVDGLDTATGVINVLPGDRLPASPFSQAAAYAEVDFRAFDDRDAYVRVSGNYIGAEWTSFEQTGAEFGNYGVVDLRAGVKLKKVEVIAFINNLANCDGKQSAAQLDTVGPVTLSDEDAYRIRPRTFGMTLKAGF
jgi:outer membrane receptor protein involved in Fe transport